MAMPRTTGLVLFWDCIVSLFGKVLITVIPIALPVGRSILFSMLRLSTGAVEFLKNVGNSGFKTPKSVMKWAVEFLKNVGNSGFKNLKSVIYYPYFQAKWRFS